MIARKLKLLYQLLGAKKPQHERSFQLQKHFSPSDFKFSLLLKTLFVTFGMLMNYCIVEIIIIPIRFCCHTWDSVVGGQCSFMCWTSTDLGYYSKYTKQVWISTNPLPSLIELSETRTICLHTHIEWRGTGKASKHHKVQNSICCDHLID